MPGDANHPTSIQPQRAIVVPRARCGRDGPALPLHSQIEPFLNRAGVIRIVGPDLSGKTTALRHLAAMFSEHSFIQYHDGTDFSPKSVKMYLMIATGDAVGPVPPLARFTLAPWTRDDCIEYLAHSHRAQVSSVIRRLTADPHLNTLGGLPALVRLVLDEMAADESVDNSIAALRRAVLRMGRMNAASSRIGAHGEIAAILAAESIVESLIKSPARAKLVASVDHQVLREVAISIGDNAAAARKLAEMMHGPDRAGDAVAAGILLKINPLWKPWVGRPLRLNDAMLDGVQWNKIDLQDTMLDGASLRGADLCDAILNRIRATSAVFSGANLNHARLDNAVMSNAKFNMAEMERIRAESAEFLGADFSGARMRSAHLFKADLGLANLTNTDLSRADLRRANLKATFNGTILTSADLSYANLEHVDLRTACLVETRLRYARLLDANLEGCEMPGADFEGADLGNALLTGSIIPGGKLLGANLRNTGLADIDWEGADLRNADLTGASFHMGSTRSGLVGSVIPCEGSKTGFYTDEFNEQDFKSPEEIRKANLCGADLRGAKIDGVDFYLVDLRGAKYTSQQAEHLARCGAILKSRVA